LDTIDWQARREGIIQAVERSLECAARQHPLVIVMEDLHWADPSSLALLKQIIQLIHQVPLLIICAFRPHHGQVSWEQLEPANDGYTELHTELKLNPLTVSESDGLLSNLIGADGLPSELVERILSQAEGNPFYLEEVLRSMIDMQTIIQDSKTGRWQVTKEINTISIPDTLQGVLIARIDRLERETRRLLQMAASTSWIKSCSG
jgi:predicted ATPase